MSRGVMRAVWSTENSSCQGGPRAAVIFQDAFCSFDGAAVGCIGRTVT
jgi:hypothetical protein